MKCNAIRRFGVAAVGALFFLIPFPASAGEGFGMMKKTANLTRINPPQIFLTGTRIAIRSTGQGVKYGPAAQRLQSQLESELLGNNPRLRLDPNPDATVDVTLLQNDYTEEWQQREGTRQVKTGAVDSKGKPIYREERVTYRVKVVGYSFSAAFKIHDARANRSLGADTINRPFSKEYQEGIGAPDPSALESESIAAVVNDLVHRLAPTREAVGVLLPKGSMENAAAFADAGLWSKYLDALERLSPLPKPTDEAYRQYALGVAYEALGYGADDVDTTLKYLEQASVHYNNAVEANPKEAYFTKAYQNIILRGRSADPPLGRVQSALVQYQRMKEFADATERASASGPVAGAKGGVGEAPSDALTNDSVVEMLRAGLPEDVILTSIDSAPKTAFDVSPKGLIQLAEAKASKKLIQRIQSAGAAKSAAKTTPKPSTAKAKKK